jgi:ferredoxin
MKVAIFTFSLTGNTKLVAKRIAEKVTESGRHSVQLFSLVKLSKEVGSLGIDSSPLLAQVRETLESSDVVGLGALVNAGYPSWRVNELFADSVLPQRCFLLMRFFFSFATAAEKADHTLDVVATILSEKNPNAVFLGSFDAKGPTNWAPMQPLRPYRDTWSSTELAKATHFGETLVELFDGRPPTARFSKTYSNKLVTCKNAVRDRFLPRPACNRSKCQRCGICASKCPYGAIILSADIEDGFPLFDRAKCEGCSRCFNRCPAEAIEMPAVHTELRSRYPKPCLLQPGEKCPDGSIAIACPGHSGIIRRVIIGYERPTAVALIAVLLLIAFLIIRRLI